MCTIACLVLFDLNIGARGGTKRGARAVSLELSLLVGGHFGNFLYRRGLFRLDDHYDFVPRHHCRAPRTGIIPTASLCPVAGNAVLLFLRHPVSMGGQTLALGSLARLVC